MAGRLKVACLGLGRMGQIFARHLVGGISEAELTAVADPMPGLAARLAAEFGAPQVFEDFRALLASSDVDAVIIATPTSTHAEVIEVAAASGRAIFCEKPLALTLEECDRAIAAVERAGVRAQIGFMRRFDAAYTRARKLIEEGAIGAPVMFKSLSRDPIPPRLEFARPEVSGGLIMDMGVHDFDVARWLMKSEVARVSSDGGTLVYEELKTVGDLDNAVVNLVFAGGALGNVEVSRNARYGYDVRTEILGSEGAVFIGTVGHTPVLLLTRAGVQHDAVPLFPARWADAFLEELRHFVRVARGDAPPGPTLRDGRAATEIALAATRSSQTGQPVSLPLQPLTA